MIFLNNRFISIISEIWMIEKIIVCIICSIWMSKKSYVHFIENLEDEIWLSSSYQEFRWLKKIIISIISKIWMT